MSPRHSETPQHFTEESQRLFIFNKVKKGREESSAPSSC
uniref:Uncharacterized protein n=1 Tax=Anguilla anguilla TaxID=7936 RepID=A0A0E9VYF1_ANGAN